MNTAIDFYFDFSSPYGYFASLHIEKLAMQYDRQVNWHAILLGPVFKTTNTVPLAMARLKGDYSAHAILVGFTYKFGAPEAPKAAPVYAAAPAATPAPAPKPTQAVIAKSYLVFFDFDKSNITPEAQKIIEQAAANAKVSKATSIALTGHTDAAGSEKYNMALSLRRANAVKAALVTLGIPENEISVVGKGKSDPLVPTKDGVREPQNRRVQILLP